VDYFQSLQIGPFVWWLDPAISHADWDSILGPFGFLHSNGPPGMAADLASMNTDISMPKGFEIITVEDEATLETWVQVFLKGYGLPLAFRDGIYTLLRDFGFDGSSRNYLGLLDGKAVCTSNVFFGAGVAGIQMVATLPEARGKGGGAAVTLKPLLEARQMGYRVGALQSSEMGYNVYKRLGFEHVCQMENYYHP
jgi:GNAT superfamily N-acetyltransferase